MELVPKPQIKLALIKKQNLVRDHSLANVQRCGMGGTTLVSQEESSLSSVPKHPILGHLTLLEEDIASSFSSWASCSSWPSRA